MKLIIDANILFSTLIKNSVAAELIFNEELTLMTSEHILTEFFKYENLILKKTSRSKESYIQVLHMLLEIIKVYPEAEYSEYMPEAKQVSQDEKDAPYFAMALKHKCAIWSNDKKIKQQDMVKIYNTSEILRLV